MSNKDIYIFYFWPRLGERYVYWQHAVNIPRTTSCAEWESLPALFTAVQVYVPSSDLFTWVKLTWPASLSTVMRPVDTSSSVFCNIIDTDTFTAQPTRAPDIYSPNSYSHIQYQLSYTHIRLSTHCSTLRLVLLTSTSIQQQLPYTTRQWTSTPQRRRGCPLHLHGLLWPFTSKI